MFAEILLAATLKFHGNVVAGLLFPHLGDIFLFAFAVKVGDPGAVNAPLDGEASVDGVSCFRDGVLEMPEMPGMRIAAVRDFAGSYEELRMVIGLRSSAGVRTDYWTRSAAFMSAGSEKEPVKGDRRMISKAGEECRYVGAVLDHQEFVDVQKTDPLKAIQSAQDAIFLGIRRHRNVRPVGDECYDALLHIGPEDLAEIV